MGKVQDLNDPVFRSDPFPTFAEMRREAPIYRVEEDGPVIWTRGPLWYVLRFVDSVEVLSDSVRFVKDYRLAFDAESLVEPPESPYYLRVITDSIIRQEAPRHTRLRGLVSKAFSAAAVRGWRGRIETITESLLDAVEARGRMDLLADFAFRLPVTVITEVLGLPVPEGERLREWVSRIGEPQSPEELEQAEARMEELFAYLRQEMEKRRREPRDDMISSLLAAELDGERLDEHEVLSTVTLLVGAGFETTMYLLGNGVLNLLRHPGEMERLRRDPELVVSAVEELLRYEGPLLAATPRWASEDVELQGARIRRGDRVVPLLLSANRDGDRFPEPDRLDLGRGDSRHLGFGHGSHFCLGAPLARLEVQIALNALLRRFPNLRLDVAEEELQRIQSPLFHGLEKLPVAWS